MSEAQTRYEVGKVSGAARAVRLVAPPLGGVTALAAVPSTSLVFAAGLDLPRDTITQKLAFLGQSGSGKSYAALRLAESLCLAGGQVIALDPVGIWHGLLQSRDSTVDHLALRNACVNRFSFGTHPLINLSIKVADGASDEHEIQHHRKHQPHPRMQPRHGLSKAALESVRLAGFGVGLL